MPEWYKKFKNKKRFWQVAVAVVLICITIFGLSALFDMCGVGVSKEVMITIPANASTEDIAQILKEDGIISYPLLFKLKIKLDGKPYMFQMGGHIVNESMSYNEIIAKLEGKPDVFIDKIKAVRVLIPEGYEIRQIAALLQEKGLADSETFIKETEEGKFDYAFIDDISRTENRLEGYLFPATYEIMPGESEYEIIDKMLKAFESKILPLYDSAKTELSLDEVVTMASLIEREAANDSERGKISSVFYNRINADMTISSCASVQYIIKERKAILSNSDIKIQSPYNTYINKGLPIGPIASPGESSFVAALEPENTDYFYFVARMDGSENVFSKTGEEHLRRVAEIQGGN